MRYAHFLERLEPGIKASGSLKTFVSFMISPDASTTQIPEA